MSKTDPPVPVNISTGALSKALDDLIDERDRYKAALVKLRDEIQEYNNSPETWGTVTVDDDIQAEDFIDAVLEGPK